MDPAELLLILVGSLVVSAFARWRGWPAPLLVVGVALGVSFIPGVPSVELDSEIVLSVILPPLLYSAALDVSFQNFSQSLRQIRRLGIGLVVITALVVGLVAWWLVPALTLPGALLLGAIVSPPDAVSASSIGRRLGLPRRVMTVLSGESLINDAASLTLFKVFVGIIAGSALSVGGVLWMFVLAIVVGLAVGLAIGIVVQFVRMRLPDSVVGTTLGLLVPFAAYAAGEALGGSGVLAVVAAGLFVGYNSPKTGYRTRLQERPVWESVDLLLEGFVFALIGLQVAEVFGAVADGALGLWPSVALAAAVLLTVLLVRPVFVFAAYYRPRLQRRLLRQLPVIRSLARLPVIRSLRRLPVLRNLQSGPEPSLSWRELTVISWTGMRGVVTLASAAAVPAMMMSGDVDGRETIILVAFCVTVGTLLLQGLSLPWVIRWLDVIDREQDDRDSVEEVRVFERSVRETNDYIDQHREKWGRKYGFEQLDESIAILKQQYERQVTVLLDENELDQQDIDAPGLDTAEAEKPRLSGPQLTSLRRELIGYRRSVVLEQRNGGDLDEEVMRSVLQGLDAEELALDTSTVTRNRS